MKTLWKSFKITIAFCIFFSLFYILVLWIFAQFAGPNKGNAEVATLNGKVVGAANVGQMFTQDIYFWGRPSAGDYTADASGGSNKGPTNDEYLAEVEARIDTFLVHHHSSNVTIYKIAATVIQLDNESRKKSACVAIDRKSTRLNSSHT